MSDLNYQIKGIITEIKDVQNISESFKKREFSIKTLNDYPQEISLEFIQDKCDELNVYKIGTEVDVFFNIKGRRWTSKNGDSKVFNTLQAWKIGVVSPQAPQQHQPAQAGPTSSAQEIAKGTDDDDLPF